jgi:hypothetical protein
MPYSYESIMQAQFERIDTETAQRAAELEAARIAEDAAGVNWAAKEILQLDAERERLAVRARNLDAQQRAQPQRHPSGLTQAEIDVAKNSHSMGTVEDRIREYSANKAKYQHQRATGQYRDDQGSIRR